MQQFTEKDHSYMRMALECAQSVKGITIPNPAVGAVIVKNDRVIATGATSRCGGPHAEKVALGKAGEQSRGATMYVTLEPCCHFGRTPPCTEAVISAGIHRVVTAIRDPNPLVAGKGIARLRRHGIAVSVGCMSRDAARLNEDFIYSITTLRAFVTLKLALTLDGYIADSAGNSKWITAPAQRRAVHELRRRHAAVAVGRGTLVADDPRLDVRYGKRVRPARIIFSSTEEIDRVSYFYKTALTNRSIVVVRGKTEQRIMFDAETGLEYWFTGERDRHDSMDVFTRMAHNADLTSIFVEGGATVARALLEAQLVNRLYLFYGNKILGGGMAGIRLGKGLPVDACITLADQEISLFEGGMAVTGIPEMSTP